MVPLQSGLQKLNNMRVAGLFAGIGGFELGLSRAGHESAVLSEIHAPACQVLRTHFPNADLLGDVQAIKSLPSDVDLLVAGFPCQDLSQAGLTEGVSGARSGLVGEIMRLAKKSKPQWIILENVPFMLHLNKGEAIRMITKNLQELGYKWAWRVVDTFGFGLPQRRERVFIVASRDFDPATVLLVDDNPLSRPKSLIGKRAHGFYWTEGRLGLGWAPDAIPTLKSGSSIGIPSPPAVLLPEGSIVKPDIRDAERLQGFRSNWTKPAEEVGRASSRWGLVGNAVSVPVATWLGRRLAKPKTYDTARDQPLDWNRSLPRAARWTGKTAHAVAISQDPIGKAPSSLVEFLKWQGSPLSYRAASSFLDRTKRSSLRFQPGFIDAVANYVGSIEPKVA